MNKNWIGMPKEPFGFSNDAKGRMGPPDFEDASFEVKKDIEIGLETVPADLPQINHTASDGNSLDIKSEDIPDYDMSPTGKPLSNRNFRRLLAIKVVCCF